MEKAGFLVSSKSKTEGLCDSGASMLGEFCGTRERDQARMRARFRHRDTRVRRPGRAGPDVQVVDALPLRRIECRT